MLEIYSRIRYGIITLYGWTKNITIGNGFGI